MAASSGSKAEEAASAEEFLGLEVPEDWLLELDDVGDPEAAEGCAKFRQEQERYRTEGTCALGQAKVRREEAEKACAQLPMKAEHKAEEQTQRAGQACDEEAARRRREEAKAEVRKKMDAKQAAPLEGGRASAKGDAPAAGPVVPGPQQPRPWRQVGSARATAFDPL